MVVNFRIYRINQGTRKLVKTLILIKKKDFTYNTTKMLDSNLIFK